MLRKMLTIFHKHLVDRFSAGYSEYTFSLVLAIILLAVGCIAVGLGLIDKINIPTDL